MKTRKLTRRQLGANLKRLAKEMQRVGAELEYYEGLRPQAIRGVELQWLGTSAEWWARELRK